MADTVKLPGLGEVNKKTATIGLAVAGGIVVYVTIRKRKAASAAVASSAQTDPAGNIGAIDPATGYVYGSQQDTQALSFAQGTGNVGGGAATTSAVTTGSAYTTNQEWLTAAAGILPGDFGTITAALDAVFGGLTVTNDQKNLFMEAVGILGPPPQGYPTPIKTSDTAPQPGPPAAPPPTPAPTVSVPPHVVTPPFNVRGLSRPQAETVISNAGYHINNVSGNPNGVVVSYTAYSDLSVNLGLN